MDGRGIIDMLFPLKSFRNQKQNMDFKKQSFHWESVMGDILLQLIGESKNTLSSIDFFLRIEAGIIRRLQLKSLRNQKTLY